ncbi:hypothetical protein Sjap_016129 [Stephania japonica]|uniref:Uncharacterized protein n=1 Tax=Stephania japonica TaxID=461633 RepID=A0AAP0IME5_9MAGN
MEFITNHSDDFAFLPAITTENYMKSDLGDVFSSSSSSPTSSSSNEFLLHQDFYDQDYNNLGQFPNLDGSKNMGSFESLSGWGAGNSNNSSLSFDIFETKPVMDGVDGTSDMIHDEKHQQMVNECGFDQLMREDKENCHQNHLIVYHQQENFSSASFVFPDEFALLATNNNQISVNEQKSCMQMLMKGSGRVGKRSHIVKGQWTLEEDRLVKNMNLFFFISFLIMLFFLFFLNFIVLFLFSFFFSFSVLLVH